MAPSSGNGRRTTADRLTTLEVEIRHTNEMFKTLLEQQHQYARESSMSRKRLYESQENIGKSLVDVKHKIERDMDRLENRVLQVEYDMKEIGPLSKDHQQLIQQTVGAGRVGKMLLRIGVLLMTFAAGVVSTITWLRDYFNGPN